MLNLSFPSLVAIVSLGISGIWLIKRSELFQISFDGQKDVQVNVKNKKSILIPVLVFMTIPFLTGRFTDFLLSSVLPYLLDEKNGNKLSFLSVLSPITTIVIFVCGQVLQRLFASCDEQKEVKKEKRKKISQLIFNMTTDIIHPLIKIESLLTYSIRSIDNNLMEFENDNICNKLNIELEHLESTSGLASLSYIYKIKNHLASLSSKGNLSSEDKLKQLSDIRLYKIEGIESIINLLQDINSDTDSLRFYTNALNQEGRNLLSQRKNRAIRNREIKKKKALGKKCEVDLELSAYQKYDIDTEEIVIQKIKEIFRGLKISTLSIDPDINNYNNFDDNLHYFDA